MQRRITASHRVDSCFAVQFHRFLLFLYRILLVLISTFIFACDRNDLYVLGDIAILIRMVKIIIAIPYAVKLLKKPW
jgi:uncharacterized membrane protein